MAIDFKCKNCFTTLRVPEEHLGKTARCPQCQELNLVQPDTFYINDNEPPVKSGVSPEPTSKPNPYQTSSNVHQPAHPRYQVGHRGGMILTLGILSIVCNFALVPGILAWVLGRADLKQMKLGIMDPEGEGITQAGMIMGIIMTSLAAIALVMYILIFVMAFGFAIFTELN